MKRTIGIIGPIRAGKDTAGSYISKALGIPVYAISAPLYEICKERGLEPIRETLIDLGTEMAAKEGDDFLAKRLLAQAPDAFIVTGIRQLGQIELLRNKSDFTLISIDANPAIRFERSQTTKKLGEADTLEEFIKRELAENSPPRAQRLFECMKRADYSLRNDGTIEELKQQLDTLLEA